MKMAPFTCLAMGAGCRRHSGRLDRAAFHGGLESARKKGKSRNWEGL